jgi:hypothetical protein
MSLRPTKVDEDAKWGGPPGPRGSPWTRSLALDHISSQPTWASAADQGSAPLGVFNGVGDLRSQNDSAYVQHVRFL